MEVISSGGPNSVVPPMLDAPVKAPKKEKSEVRKFVEEAVRYVKEGVGVFMKGVKMTKSVTGFVEEFTAIPFVLGEILYWTAPIKIIMGIPAVPKLVKSTIKLIKADTWGDRLSHAWSMVKSTKKIVGTIAGIGKILKNFEVIPKVAMVWTRFTGYIFFPIGFIDTGISIYKLHKNVSFMRDFSKQTKVAKEAQPEQQIESMKRAITYIKSSAKKLEDADVVNLEKFDLDARMDTIFKRLKSDNAVEQKEAFDEGKMVISKLKGRIRAHVVSDAIDTSLSIVGCAMAIMGLAVPALTLPAAAVGLATATLSTANFIHSKVMPTGDIKADEITSPYALAFKGVKHVKKDVTRFCRGVVNDVGHSLEGFGKKLQLAAAAA